MMILISTKYQNCYNACYYYNFFRRGLNKKLKKKEKWNIWLITISHSNLTLVDSVESIRVRWKWEKKIVCLC